jgi:hypothetical protein
MEDREVNNLAMGFNASDQFFEYIFLSDKDNYSDLLACRAGVHLRYPAVRSEKVQMVCAEIESWYLAGLTTLRVSKLGMRNYNRPTDTIGKEHFNTLIPQVYRRDRRVFLIEILKSYSVSEAKRSNASFKSFCAGHQTVVSKS